jgi:hypothetical protein
MRKVIIAILVAIILVLGFLFFTQKKTDISYEPWPETEPATVKSTSNYPVQNNPTPTQVNPTTPTTQTSTTKTFSGYGFKINYPKDIVVQEEDAEGGPYRIIYFVPDAMVSVVSNADFHEQYSISEYEYLTTKTVNGITFEMYQSQGAGVAETHYWLRMGNTGYEITFLPGSRMSLETFGLI